MATVGYKHDSGVMVFDIPESMALGYLAKTIPSAECGLSFAESLVAEIKQRLADGDRKFVIDLTRLSYIDSAGVGIVVGCRNLVVGAGGAVRAVTPQDRVHGVFDLHSLGSVLPLDRSLDAALAALNGK